MPKINVCVPHSLDPDQVVEKVKPALEKTVTDFQGRDFEHNWSDRSAHFSFKSMSFTIRGDVTVDERQVVVGVELPFAAMMFKERAEKAITKNLTRALEP